MHRVTERAYLLQTSLNTKTDKDLVDADLDASIITHYALLHE